MLDDFAGDWAQVGWEQEQGTSSVSFVFTETYERSTNRLVDGYGPDLAIGSSHAFLVTWYASQAPFDMWVDGTVMSHSTGNWIPSEAVDAVETVTWASEMGGGYGNNGGNNEVFQSAGAWIGNPQQHTGSWYNLGPNATHMSSYAPREGWNWDYTAPNNPSPAYVMEYSPDGQSTENVWDWGCY